MLKIHTSFEEFLGQHFEKLSPELQRTLSSTSFLIISLLSVSLIGFGQHNPKIEENMQTTLHAKIESLSEQQILDFLSKQGIKRADIELLLFTPKLTSGGVEIIHDNFKRYKFRTLLDLIKSDLYRNYLRMNSATSQSRMRKASPFTQNIPKAPEVTIIQRGEKNIPAVIQRKPDGSKIFRGLDGEVIAEPVLE